MTLSLPGLMYLTSKDNDASVSVRCDGSLGISSPSLEKRLFGIRRPTVELIGSAYALISIAMFHAGRSSEWVGQTFSGSSAEFVGEWEQEWASQSFWI